jgi:hypothetical protein
MKKIALLLLISSVSTLALAHEVPVPHAHQDYVHGLVPFLKYIVFPVAIGLAVLKLYKHFKNSVGF